MLIKEADDKSEQISMLERLLTQATNGQKRNIETELRNLRAGIKAEKDAAYLIDFSFRNARNWMVIHDLRIEVNDRVAQIDHLLMSRFLEIYVLETKSFHTGFKITNDGEFLRWNSYRKTYEGMASPIAQNNRHAQVLKDLLKQLPLPTRMGFRLEPTIIPLVLVSSKSRIDRPSPRKFDTRCVIKADALEATVTRDIDEKGTLGVLASAAKVVGPETLEELARAIAAEHKPISFDYAARFGMNLSENEAADAPQVARSEPKAARSKFRKTPAVGKMQTPSRPSMGAQRTAHPAAAPETAKPSAPSTSTMPVESEAPPRCRNCESTELVILYGKYGYYFKCAACSGNTPIKLYCGRKDHFERLRKDGRRFYRECSSCRTSTLFFENPERSDSDSQHASPV